MSETKKTEQFLREKKRIEGKQVDEKRNLVITISIASFLTFCCCTLFFFFIYRNAELAAYGNRIFTILQPIIIGMVLAYLLNPIMVVIENFAQKQLKKKIKNEKRVKSLSRMLGITGAWLLFGFVIVVLVASILPTIMESIMSMIRSFPDEVNNLLKWLDEVVEDGSELETYLNEMIVKTSAWFQTWLAETVLPQMEGYITSIMSGAVAGVKTILNVFIGVVVSVYVLTTKDTFSGQAKKIIYAFLF